MLSINSRVITKDNKEGIVLELDDKFAKVLINNEYRWYKIDELKDVSDDIIDKFLRGEYDKPMDFIISIDAYRLLSEYRSNPYVLASSTKVEIFPHQIDEVVKILDEPHILLADEVGLGKTITTAIVASELKARGIVKRVLFVVPKSLTIKWRDELNTRFELDAKIIDADYMRVNDNAFKEREFCYVSSLDYLKQEHVMRLLDKVDIDLVVIDEAHKLTPNSNRYNLGKYLATLSTFMLLLTATPHNGDDDDYLARLQLLDPYITNINTSNYLLIRNIKEDVIDLDGKEVFPKRESKSIEINLSKEEIIMHNKLDDYLAQLTKYSYGDKERENAARFISMLLRKRLSSSIHALRLSLERRLKKLGNSDLARFKKGVDIIKEGEEEFDESEFEQGEDSVIGYTTLREKSKEEEIINDILSSIKSINHDTKLEVLLNYIKTIKQDKDAKIVIFTEYRDTLYYLKDKMKGYKVVSIDGTMNVNDRKEALDEFRFNADIMLCTDAAGEGIDMQFCNILINYDLPWNPNRLEQRMGRIHRIGQRKNVYYYNFILDPKNTLDGYIFNKLLNKIESIKHAIGDKIYDILGRLISEEDIAMIYEELLKVPKDKWDAKIRIIDGIIERKRKILEQIDLLQSGYRLDRSKLEDMKYILKNAVDSNEIKRFVSVFLELYKGEMIAIDKESEIYKIYMPRVLSNTPIIEGSFSKDIAISKNLPYLALGNHAIMSMLKHTIKPKVAVFKHRYLHGLLFIFQLSIYNRYSLSESKVVSLLVDDNIKEIDTKGIWEFEPIEDNYQSQISSNILLDEYKIAKDYTNDMLANMLEKNEIKNNTIKEKAKSRMQEYYSSKLSECNNKIREYELRLRDEPHLKGMITQKHNEINRLKEELDNKLKEFEDNYKLYSVIELIGIAEIIPDKNSDNRLMIEKAGMARVLEYEKNRAKSKEELDKIKDVSDKLVGYDIESFDRVIEVKSFQDTGIIELTSHEWITASRLKDEYWLYIVEDALKEGKIYTFKNPVNLFKDKVRKIPIIDYRYMISDWHVNDY
jgi:superfamily II DNA or RNA helicase